MPVSLTLASRPVMAWHCNTTSAWGSAVLRNGGASVQARADKAVINETECWFTNNWINNTVRSQVSSTAPWEFARRRWASNRTLDWLKSNLTVATVFNGGTCYGVSGTAKVWTHIRSNQSSLSTLLIVARLNTLFAGHNVASCVISNTGGGDMLLRMASQGPGVFKPANATLAWTDSDMRRYLRENWLAVST